MRSFVNSEIVWAEMGKDEHGNYSSEHPAYHDVYHPVQVVSVLKNKEYRCKMIAFDGEPEDEWAASQLFSLLTPIVVMKKRVPGKLCLLRVNGRKADGYFDREGVYIKGRVNDDGSVCIRDWDHAGHFRNVYNVRVLYEFPFN